MFEKFNNLVQKVKTGLRAIFPETVTGKAIDISKGANVYGTLGYVAVKDPEADRWDIYIRLLRQSRGTPTLTDRSMLLVGSAPDKESAVKLMEKRQPSLPGQAAAILTQMGYKEPRKAFPAVAELIPPRH